MSRQDSEFDPTHVLVVTDSEDSEEIRATNAAVDAVLDHADVVDIWINKAQLRDDHPSLVDSLENAFVQVDGDHFSGEVDAVRASLSELLSVSSFHRFISLERLEASRGDETLLYYVPDHRQFRIDASVSPGVDDAIRGAIEHEDAALLPAGSLSDWYDDGTHYELSPPHLCVDDKTCHDLTQISHIELDDDRHEIRIEWGGRSTGLVSNALSKVGPSKPSRFQFDSVNRYETVAAAFGRLRSELDW